MKRKIKQEKRNRRHRRIKARLSGTAERPRLCVFRSAKHIYGQLIDDERGVTLVSGNDKEIKVKTQKSKVKTTTQNLKVEKEKIVRTKKTALAYKVGKLIAEKALGKNIEKVVFDRGGYRYHGRVKALAEGAREGGLKF